MKLSLLNSDLTITGNVNGDGKIQLNGVICGEIKSFSVTVGQSGLVHGTIDADEVIIFGTVIGKINAKSIKIINAESPAAIQKDLLKDLSDLGNHNNTINDQGKNKNDKKMNTKKGGKDTHTSSYKLFSSSASNFVFP